MGAAAFRGKVIIIIFLGGAKLRKVKLGKTFSGVACSRFKCFPVGHELTVLIHRTPKIPGFQLFCGSGVIFLVWRYEVQGNIRQDNWESQAQTWRLKSWCLNGTLGWVSRSLDCPASGLSLGSGFGWRMNERPSWAKGRQGKLLAHHVY